MIRAKQTSNISSSLLKMVSSAHSIFLFSLLILFVISNAQNPPKPKAFLFPIYKDDTTNQYFTSIQFGSNSTTLNVVIDLGGKFLFFNSDEYISAASTFKPILCGTQLCRIADGIGCTFCFLRPPMPGCTNNTCTVYSLNPFTGTQGYAGLGTDTLHIYSTHGDRYNFRNYPFQYGQDALLQGLASPTAGVVGLGRTRISLLAQLVSTYKVREKFTLCIPSSGNFGKLIIGQGIYNSPFQTISKSLISTPLIKNPVGTYQNMVIGNLTAEYFIGVKSIKVDSKTLSINTTLLSINKNTGAGGTSLRTVRYYTGFHQSIYRVLVNEFVKAARSKNITRVASVAPFGACFDTRTISTTKTGPRVPIVDLVLQSKNVYWRLNSMVQVNNNVTCLAFVEGQTDQTGSPTTSIVVGGYQMENHLLEFDVASSKLRFSPSLLLRDTSCSEFQSS